MKLHNMSPQDVLPTTSEPTKAAFVVELVEVRGVIMILTRYFTAETSVTNRTLELFYVKVNCSVVNQAIVVRGVDFLADGARFGSSIRH